MNRSFLLSLLSIAIISGGCAHAPTVAKLVNKVAEGAFPVIEDYVKKSCNGKEDCTARIHRELEILKKEVEEKQATFKKETFERIEVTCKDGGCTPQDVRRIIFSATEPEGAFPAIEGILKKSCNGKEECTARIHRELEILKKEVEEKQATFKTETFERIAVTCKDGGCTPQDVRRIILSATEPEDDHSKTEEGKSLSYRMPYTEGRIVTIYRRNKQIKEVRFSDGQEVYRTRNHVGWDKGRFNGNVIHWEPGLIQPETADLSAFENAPVVVWDIDRLRTSFTEFRGEDIGCRRAEFRDIPYCQKLTTTNSWVSLFGGAK